MAQIRLDGLRHSYSANPQSDEDYALKRLSITWQDGGAYALLGPSGCGKTTLLNLISGLLTPTEGKILFDGRDIGRLPPNRRAELGFGRTFQISKTLTSMSVLENGMVGAFLHHLALDLGQRDDLVDRRVELAHHRGGRALGREEAEPGAGLEAGVARLGHRGHLGHGPRTLGAADRQRPQRTTADVLDDRRDGGEHELHAAHLESVRVVR